MTAEITEFVNMANRGIQKNTFQQKSQIFVEVNYFFLPYTKRRSQL
jgi:hypothetical protein